MNEELSSYFLPDLIVKTCPLGCNQACSRVWINENIRHRIVCNCNCQYHEKEYIEYVDDNAIRLRKMIRGGAILSNEKETKSQGIINGG